MIRVDVVEHTGPGYPGVAFVKGDALDVLDRYRDRVDAVHTSPPCQKWSHGNAANDTTGYVDLLTPHRAALKETGLPYVIENGTRAPLVDPLILCGSMFGMTATDDDGTTLHLRRHRGFESNVLLVPPRPCSHPRGVQWAGSYGGARRDKHEARHVRKGGYVPPVHVLRLLMQMGWADEHGLFQAIPPTYTRWIGEQLRAHLETGVAA